MFPEIAGPVADLSADAVDAELESFARYAVYRENLPQVPAIKPEEGAHVLGKLYFGVTEDAWRRLDYFEGVDDGDYSRQTVTVKLANGSKAEADTYVAGSNVWDNLRGPWDPAVFAEQHLIFYIRHLLPQFVMKRT